MGIDLSKTNAKFKACLPKDFYGPVREMETKKSKSHQGRAGQNSDVASGQGRGGFRIQLIQLRRRLLDGHDNMRSACKPAVDRITHRLGFTSDNDERIVWEYHQLRTAGEEQLLVVIEPL